MSKLQAILFDRKYWNIMKINDFLNDHYLNLIKPLTMTKKYYHVRLRKPSWKKKYRTKEINEGLKFIFEVPN